MNDIVERLRNAEQWLVINGDIGIAEIVANAAAEIQRLRKEIPIVESVQIDRLRSEVERLTAELEDERKKNKKLMNRHEVACILAELTGTNYACDVYEIDEWLPEKCDFAMDECGHTIGVACWEQYLKHRNEIDPPKGK